ncbi:hypothetical protein BC826DRAFT_971017 [Russula brevipes]|nr:hypothetical protein BC826DRAFT_971017 [Russula brevipes]
MLSPVKIALFAFISFATLALAVPSPAGHVNDPKALIISANVALEKILFPLTHLTAANATSDCIVPVINEVVETVDELIIALQNSSLSGCGCTGHDIIKLVAITLEIIFKALSIVHGSYSDLGVLLGDLISRILVLLDVVVALVGGLVGELLFLLLGKNCVGILLDLKLGALLDFLGLGGLLGHLL